MSEIRFRLRLPTGFNYNDYSYNEIDYELERRKRQNESALSRSVEILEIDDISDNEGEWDSPQSMPKMNKTQPKSKPPMLRKGSLQQVPKKLLKRTNTEVEMVVDSLDSDSEEEESSDSEGDVVVSLCLSQPLKFVLLNLSQTINFRLFQTERVCITTSLNLMKMVASSLKGWKTLGEKKKLLITSNFFFSQSVFKRLVLQTHENQGLFGEMVNKVLFETFIQ